MTTLQDLVQGVCNLLNCERGCLVLQDHTTASTYEQTEAVSQSRWPAYGSSEALALLTRECIAALCDIVIQTGHIWCIDSLERQKNTTTTKASVGRTQESVLAAPLFCPQGISGVLVLYAASPQAFAEGEYRLLQHYLPTLALHIDAVLQASYLATSGHPEESASVVNDRPLAPNRSIWLNQSELLSLICHELRVPLSAIKGYAALLQAYGNETTPGEQSSILGPQRQQQYLGAIIEQSDHLETLISELLDMSRMQTGRLTLRPDRVDLVQICQRVVQLMSYRSERHILHCTSDVDLPHAWADSVRVRQVLLNLLENAIKYSPNGGLIEVSVSTHRPFFFVTRNGEPPEHTVAHRTMQIYITVRDQGIGIPSHKQRLVFHPFTRLEHSATRHIHGMGLGLYIARQLVEGMGGNIVLRSQEGRGTSITFTLPVQSNPCLLARKQKVPEFLPVDACTRRVSGSLW